MKMTLELPLKSAEKFSVADFSQEKMENQKDLLLLNSPRNQLSTKLLHTMELTLWEEPSLFKNLKVKSLTKMALEAEITIKEELSNSEISLLDLKEQPISKLQLFSLEDSHTCPPSNQLRITSNQLVR